MSGKAEDSGVATIPSSEQAEWADVSSLLRNACKDLHDGELIHGENFSLFSAMSALEIMDPKMDSGMVSKYRSVDEAIENGVAPVPLGFDRTIDVQCIIDIMDHLLSCEATWHKGQSLAQTIYSCIYLLRPERTSSHALLHSYCRIIRATCKAVISVVSDTRTHEEEDLFTMSHGLPLNGDGDEKCLTMLNAVEETLSRQLRASKATSMKKRLLEDIEPLQTNPDLEEGYCKAILSRLRFRKHFYHVLTSMRRPQGRGLGLARKHIASCFVELEGLRSSSGFLRSSAHRSCKAGENDRTTASGSHPIGFDPNLNSKFAAPTPPRSIRTLSWDKAIEYFEKLLHDLDVICSHSSDPLLEGVLQFVVQFQKSQPDLVARAHLQLLVVQDGKLYGKEPMFAVICKAAALPEDIMNHDIQKNEYIVHLGLLLINLLKILCTNVAWQRRKLGKILQDWCVIHIQVELSFRKEFGELLGNINDENLCVKLAKNILIWIEEQTYWIATRFLVLGFELELYTAGEYCMVYWYLHIVLIMLAEKIHLRTAAKNNTAKRKGKKKRDSTRDAAKDNQIPPAMLFLQCQIYIAEGLAMMLAALRNEQKVFQSPGPFNTENEKFAQHFEPLQKACIPDNISYLSFMEFTTYTRFSTLSVYNYFKEAQRIAKELRSSYSNDTDKLAELRRLEQVAEHNGVALNLICRVGTLDPSLKVSFEFGHHPHFATAVVKRSHGRSLS